MRSPTLADRGPGFLLLAVTSVALAGCSPAGSRSLGSSEQQKVAVASAFGREAAADALLLQTEGRVLHVVVQTSSNNREGYDPRDDIDQRWSAWVDPDPYLSNATHSRISCAPMPSGSGYLVRVS